MIAGSRRRGTENFKYLWLGITMGIATAFRDKTSLKAVVLAFLAYLVLVTVLFAIVIHFWLPAGISPQEAERLAAVDPTLLIWERVWGLCLATFAGYLACRLSGRVGLKNSLALGALLVAYGILAIYLHPSDPISTKVAELLTPIPIALLGGWLCLRFATGPKVRGNA